MLPKQPQRCAPHYYMLFHGQPICLAKVPNEVTT
jgi:hypothetical protein